MKIVARMLNPVSSVVTGRPVVKVSQVGPQGPSGEAAAVFDYVRFSSGYREEKDPAGYWWRHVQQADGSTQRVRLTA
jgi:hypothetical protein